jgi:hypothetical protein
VHEIAHEMLHRGERRMLTTKQVREPRPKLWLSWSASPSDFKAEPRPRTTSSFGAETPISCARA